MRRLPDNHKKSSSIRRRRWGMAGGFLVLCLPLIRQSLLSTTIIYQDPLQWKNAALFDLPSWPEMLSNNATADAGRASKVDANGPERMLETLNITYYIYDDPGIFYPEFFSDNQSTVGIEGQEIQMIRAFLNHPRLRTHNPEEADLFVVPVPFLSIKRWQALNLLEALQKSLIFQKHAGANRHLLFAIEGRILEAESKWKVGPHVRARYQGVFRNATMVKKFDIFQARELVDDPQYSDWQDLFASYQPYYKHAVGPGLLDAVDLPLIPATWTKFQQSTIHIFYHTRRASSARNSTIYRHAPLGPKTTSWPFETSIGFDISKDEWRRRFVQTKFCLAIRGDDPATSAVNRALKVGCIPIIISDVLPLYAPPFKDILNLDNFAFFLQESTFLQNPFQSLVDLIQNASDIVLQDKLLHMRVAQRLIFPDHPESLFVEAVLYETMLAYGTGMDRT